MERKGLLCCVIECCGLHFSKNLYIMMERAYIILIFSPLGNPQ